MSIFGEEHDRIDEAVELERLRAELAERDREITSLRHYRQASRDLQSANAHCHASIAALEADLAQAQARVTELSEMKPQTMKQRIEALEAALRYIGKACDLSDDETDVGITYRECFPPGIEGVP